jgi:hypothetical protein
MVDRIAALRKATLRALHQLMAKDLPPIRDSTCVTSLKSFSRT